MVKNHVGGACDDQCAELSYLARFFLARSNTLLQCSCRSAVVDLYLQWRVRSKRALSTMIALSRAAPVRLIWHFDKEKQNRPKTSRMNKCARERAGKRCTARHLTLAPRASAECERAGTRVTQHGTHSAERESAGKRRITALHLHCDECPERLLFVLKQQINKNLLDLRLHVSTWVTDARAQLW